MAIKNYGQGFLIMSSLYANQMHVTQALCCVIIIIFGQSDLLDKSTETKMLLTEFILTLDTLSFVQRQKMLPLIKNDEVKIF